MRRKNTPFQRPTGVSERAQEFVGWGGLQWIRQRMDLVCRGFVRSGLLVLPLALGVMGSVEAQVLVSVPHTGPFKQQ